MQIDTIADQSPELYLVEMKARYREALEGMAPMVAQFVADESVEYVLRMRYQGNLLKIWFMQKEFAEAGLKPLAEAPTPKDGWISAEAEVVSCPPIPDEYAEARANPLFSGVVQGIRALNPEIPYCTCYSKQQ
jgi:hypothetical protein